MPDLNRDEFAEVREAVEGGEGVEWRYACDWLRELLTAHDALVDRVRDLERNLQISRQARECVEAERDRSADRVRHLQRWFAEINADEAKRNPGTIRGTKIQRMCAKALGGTPPNLHARLDKAQERSEQLAVENEALAGVNVRGRRWLEWFREQVPTARLEHAAEAALRGEEPPR